MVYLFEIEGVTTVSVLNDAFVLISESLLLLKGVSSFKFGSTTSVNVSLKRSPRSLLSVNSRSR